MPGVAFGISKISNKQKIARVNKNFQPIWSSRLASFNEHIHMREEVFIIKIYAMFNRIIIEFYGLWKLRTFVKKARDSSISPFSAANRPNLSRFKTISGTWSFSRFSFSFSGSNNPSPIGRFGLRILFRTCLNIRTELYTKYQTSLTTVQIIFRIVSCIQCSLQSFSSFSPAITFIYKIILSRGRQINP